MFKNMKLTETRTKNLKTHLTTYYNDRENFNEFVRRYLNKDAFYFNRCGYMMLNDVAVGSEMSRQRYYHKLCVTELDESPKAKATAKATPEQVLMYSLMHERIGQRPGLVIRPHFTHFTQQETRSIYRFRFFGEEFVFSMRVCDDPATLWNLILDHFNSYKHLDGIIFWRVVKRLIRRYFGCTISGPLAAKLKHLVLSRGLKLNFHDRMIMDKREKGLPLKVQIRICAVWI